MDKLTNWDKYVDVAIKPSFFAKNNESNRNSRNTLQNVKERPETQAQLGQGINMVSLNTDVDLTY